MSFNPKSRRLLNPERLAKRLGYSTSWLTENLKRLEAAGMPEPFVKADENGPDLWDEYAIDLWQNSGIPAHLRQDNTIETIPIDHSQVAATLRERAEAFA